MSNVLIGIIGVILFIGLALAGALFLGPRFQEATTNSQAASVMSGIQQMAAAAELYRTQEGVSKLRVADENALFPGYAKSRPRNASPAARRAPAGEAFRYSIHLNNDICPDNIPESASMELTFVMTSVGFGEDDDKLCQAIARQSGGRIVLWDTTAKSGCIKVPDSCGLVDGASYIAYQKL